ncbi:MAG: hypothetical protein E7424_07975 [Ruminococcaceae bacterium]|nr:hypothetical protein [Oscillospiraceae bacterium]
MRCAIYCRLSKEDTNKRQPESESIQNQKNLLTRYALDRDWEIFGSYCDEDYSGADAARPEFNRMLHDAENRRFGVILCKSQSRFTRDMELVERYIHGLFPRWGVRFIAVADNADTEIRGNKKARQINGLVNEWYLEDLSENVRMVLDHKRRSGQYLGGIPLYGYKKDPADRHRLIIDEPAASVVRTIFDRFLRGCGPQRIAGMLNAAGIVNPTSYKKPDALCSSLWSRATVSRMLRNEMYAGVLVQGRQTRESYKSKRTVAVPPQNWVRIEGAHAAIISPDVYAAAQRLLRARSLPSPM